VKTSDESYFWGNWVHEKNLKGFETCGEVKSGGESCFGIRWSWKKGDEGGFFQQQHCV
jgi:hypothetical protein